MTPVCKDITNSLSHIVLVEYYSRSRYDIGCLIVAYAVNGLGSLNETSDVVCKLNALLPIVIGVRSSTLLRENRLTFNPVELRCR